KAWPSALTVAPDHPSSGLMTQFHDHLRVTLTQGLQRQQALPFAFPVEGIASGFDAMLPAPTGMASVAGEEHRTRRCAVGIGDMTLGMSRRQDCKQRAITEDIDHPIEFPIRVF